MKRLLDLVVATIMLVITLPLIVLLSLLIVINLGSPALFRQERPGMHAKPFTMLKFRTMREAVDTEGRLLTDAERLTPFGRMLRSTSLDELPSLWNVLKGDMSLVGPRPLLMEYLMLYSPQQARRHEVKPGITGWAQVNGRNALSWDEKFEFDLWYVTHNHFWLDIRILCLTLHKVLIREGITAEGQATIGKFTGSKQ